MCVCHFTQKTTYNSSREHTTGLGNQLVKSCAGKRDFHYTFNFNKLCGLVLTCLTCVCIISRLSSTCVTNCFLARYVGWSPQLQVLQLMVRLHRICSLVRYGGSCPSLEYWWPGYDTWPVQAVWTRRLGWSWVPSSTSVWVSLSVHRSSGKDGTHLGRRWRDATIKWEWKPKNRISRDSVWGGQV